MEKASSADGTTIAYEAWGSGQLVVIVGGAFNVRDTWAELAQVLAKDFRVVSYDRRGRGDSGDTQPYAVEREPVDMLGGLDVPVLAVTSTGTQRPWLSESAGKVAAAAPDGRLKKLEGGFHEVPPSVLAPALREFYTEEG